MNSIHLCYSDINGGAARAAYRIHHALRRFGFDSIMQVTNASAGDWTVNAPNSKVARAVNRLRPTLGSIPNRLLKSGNPIIHSSSVLPSGLHKKLNASRADVLHMHWVNNEMLSIAEIGKLRKPLVWTLHDMWAFCGAEHLSSDFRWRDGYLLTNRPSHESGFDLNRWTWQRKIKHWRHPIQIVCPSHWLAECAKASVLMRNWPVSVIPNCIDTLAWQPIDKAIARQLLHLPPDAPLLAFGAMGSVKEPHKGFDLLQQALNHLRGQIPGLELIIFGQLAPKQAPDLGLQINYTGHLHDDVALQLLYSAADVLVIPSRQDNLPNTGVEAHACGTPVVAFNTCGLPDIVQHQVTGYLAQRFDTTDLATGIDWVLKTRERHQELSRNARARALQLWSEPVVAERYAAAYRQAVNRG